MDLSPTTGLTLDKPRMESKRSEDGCPRGQYSNEFLCTDAHPCRVRVCQFYNLYLDSGVLVEGAAGSKALASLLPAMAFYLGASQMSKYEGSQQGITWSNLTEGDFPFSATLFFLALDTALYTALAWYLDQVHSRLQHFRAVFWGC
eukprot:6186300-Pleurochrysis_carterae.AAC.2